MKIVIVSDSHGWKAELTALLDRIAPSADQIVHVGDSELDTEAPELAGVQTVAGNCDLFASFPNELKLNWAGIPVYVAHGHHYGVKQSLTELAIRTRNAGAKIAVYGHTHIAVAEKKQDVLLINPGSVRLPNGYPEGTYCIVESDGKKVEVTYYTIDGKVVPHLSDAFEV